MWTEQEMQEKMGKIHNVDCLEFMRKVPDNYFDLILTDPPYGIGIDGQKESININNPKANRKHHDFKGWDNGTPPKEYFDEIFRISKYQIIWGANYFIDKLQGATKGWVVWDKGQRGLTMSDCELCFTSFQKATRIVTFNRVEIQCDGSVHPTQKPEKLFEYCMRFAMENADIKNVYDPFFGSGTTGVIAKRLNIDFCATEKEPDYVEIASKRLKYVQGCLF